MITTHGQELTIMVNEYQQIALRNEALTQQITGLLAARGGFTHNLSEDDFVTYRQLARQRDWVH